MKMLKGLDEIFETEDNGILEVIDCGANLKVI